jgi:DNA-directed RNA polymerase specialized sigma24 family protein
MITMGSRPQAVHDPFYPFLVRAVPLVHQYLWERLVDRRRARQLTTEVFADALRAWPFGPNAGGEVAYTIGLARSRLIREYGRLSYHSFDAAAGGASGARAIALGALAALSRRSRQAALLRYVDGLETNEIARLLGCRPATARRVLRRVAAGGDASPRSAMNRFAGLVSGAAPTEPSGDYISNLYARLSRRRHELAMSGSAVRATSRPQSRSAGLLLWSALALLAAGLLFAAPAPQANDRSQPRLVAAAEAAPLSAPEVARGGADGSGGLGAVTAMPIYPLSRLPFELIAVEPASGAVATVDLAGGLATVYQPPASLLARLSMTSVVPFGQGWLTLADGLLWWFEDGIADPPALLLEADPEDLAKLDYVVAAGTATAPESVWAVQPGPGYRDLDEPSIVQRIAVADPSAAVMTLAPPDVRPVVATAAGLLVNQSGWIEVGTVHVEAPESRQMMLIGLDGSLIPLWSGLAVDLLEDQLVWVDCAANGDQCRVVVSELTMVEGRYIKGTDRVIGDSAISLVPVENPGVAAVSPDGRWLVAERRFTDGRPDASLVLVDLRDGTVSAPIGSVPAPASRAPAAVWSAEGDWLVVIDDRPRAIRVSDRVEIALWDWIPAGMEILAVAPR